MSMFSSPVLVKQTINLGIHRFWVTYWNSIQKARFRVTNWTKQYHALWPKN